MSGEFEQQVELGGELYTVQGCLHSGACSEGDAEHAVWLQASEVEIYAVLNEQGNVLAVPDSMLDEIKEQLAI